MSSKFKSGFITIVGQPNVGKSTLLNKLTGEKVAIVSNKPQTTRNTIKSILTSEKYQFIFIDTPGIHRPKNKLGDYMVEAATNTFKEVDIILFVTDLSRGSKDIDSRIIQMFNDVDTPVFLIINKADIIDNRIIKEKEAEYKSLYDFNDIIEISALRGTNVDILVDKIYSVMPEGPKYFPDDMYTDQPERTIVAEIIREKILELLEQEVPHGIMVEVDTFKERSNRNIIYISANIICEKNSHKGIVIGKRGNMLKEIGRRSRAEIQNLLGTKVYLDLWVKVNKDWRNKSNYLKFFGYK
ncbi:MAG: GTPase Era [Clostridia bacterium]|nr:GTPase Era [Clostridia bacterium]